MNISIGTAQFMNNYGINNTSKRFSYAKKFRLLKNAQNYNIRDIDTAFSYGNAHKELGKIGLKKFRITTKLPSISFKTKNYEKKILALIIKAKKDMRVNKIDTVLIHSYKNLIQSDKKKYINSLKKIKTRGLIKKIGISLYETNEIFEVLKFWTPDVVQLPYNILDRRIEKKNFLPSLKKKKIKIQVRSIFLQGLLTRIERPKKFKRWKKYFDKWFNWCEINKINPRNAALLFVKNNKFIDKIIIGLESPNQLDEIVKIKKVKRKFFFPDIGCKDKKLLNPFNW